MTVRRDAGSVSAVSLTGRVTAPPETRELPSGDVLAAFRVSVARGPTPLARSSRQRSDWVDCVTLDGRCRRAVARWSVGDVVEVEGVLRRRFYRTAHAAGSRLEVEALTVRRVARAATLTRP